MTYTAPVADIAFTLNEIAGFREALSNGAHGDLSEDLVTAVLEEAGKFATEQVAPLNRNGDIEGAVLDDKKVTMPKGWKAVYDQWAESGWGAVAGDEKYGGQGLPVSLAIAVQDMWNSASMAFGIGTVLTHGATEAIAAHGTEDLCKTYLTRMVSGEWTGTMNLTEPHSGSDLSVMRSKAEPQGDGTYLIKGTKIFITYGEHDLTDNIIHLVLARLPDAPAGTRGISLFLVPKFLVNEDGSLGDRNDVYCTGMEHKLGIHASPTCTMTFGDNGGAVGYLIGEENRGLNCMFTMMNNARLSVGIQGVAIAERAYQGALAYAQERRQGKAPGWIGDGPDSSGMSPIIDHPDVRRMLMTMKSMTAAIRAICYVTAAAIDCSHGEGDENTKAEAKALADLLTPIAKAFSTDVGVEVASIGVQIHGGMGYVEETGAAQHYRDARIAPIYEGTNGIQAIDLLTRKLPLHGGESVRALISDFRDVAEDVMGEDNPDFGRMGYRLNEAVKALEGATDWMLQTQQDDMAQALAGATPYLRMFGLTAGAAYLARGALAAAGTEAGSNSVPGAIATARYFAEYLLPETLGLKGTVTHGADALLSVTPEQLIG